MLVYLDTNIWVYAYENNPVFGQQAHQLLSNLQHGRHRIASSLFVLGELLVMPTRKNNPFTVAIYKRLFNAPTTLVLPYTQLAADVYAAIRAQHRFEPLDALHLAVASTAGVGLFVTEDTKILGKSIPGIGQIADLTVTLP